MRKKYKSVEGYISDFPKELQDRMERVSKAIKSVAPKSSEAISYGIPVFKLEKTHLIYFAAFKNHLSIYPAPRGTEEFGEELTKYKGGKGTVQFPNDKPLPIGLIKRIVKFRIKDTQEKSEHGKAGKVVKKPTSDL